MTKLWMLTDKHQEGILASKCFSSWKNSTTESFLCGLDFQLFDKVEASPAYKEWSSNHNIPSYLLPLFIDPGGYFISSVFNYGRKPKEGRGKILYR